MTDPTPSSRPSLWRDVLVIVLAGGALGAGYNQIQLRSGESGRGLAWVKSEAKLASLESLLADSAASATPVSTPAAPDTTRATSDPAPAAAPHDAPAPVARDTTHTRPASTPASAPVQTPPAASAAPAPTASPTVAAPDVPTIPDTREPLEVQYPLVKKLFDAGAALFVDARSPEEFAEGHIRGAVNLPFDDVFRKPELAKTLADGGKPIVAYCDGGDCELSRNLAFSLIEGGHRKVLVFTGGTAGWTAAGQTLEKGAAR